MDGIQTNRTGFSPDMEEPFNDGESSEDRMGGDEKMSEIELQSIVAGELYDAVRYIDLEIGNARAAATQYYRGDPLGDEEEGRSQVISYDVRDTVQAMLPSLMRIFMGPENVVEYVPENEAQVEMADQATDYANYIVQRDNPGYTVIYNAIKDALIHKVGFVKFWWDDREEVRTEHYTGLDDDALALLLSEQDAETTIVEAYKAETQPQPEAQPSPDGQEDPAAEALNYDVEVKRRIKHGRVAIQALPPEEFIIDRRARSLDDAVIVAHRSMKTVSELVQMGYKEEEVLPYVGNFELDTNIEYITRQPLARAVGSMDTINPEMQRVLYLEAFVKVDYDGDGIAELRKCCTMGPSYKLVKHEAAAYLPFADFPCDPEPHAFFGLSIADVTMDLQKIKSHILRNTLDSLAQSIHPRTAIVEGQVNIDDVLNNEVGAIIRQRAPGMVTPFSVDFVGREAFPMLQYMDDVRESRTGMSKASMGLDADALQSSTKAAVSGTLQAAQQRIELVARTIAETGMKRLFKGILYLICQHQTQSRMVKLRNKWVQIDPRYWNADMDVAVNVALGTTDIENKIQALTGVLQKQEFVLQTLGADNPLVKPYQYSNTLQKLVELLGFKDTTKYFMPIPVDYQPPQPQQHPDPNVLLAQAQMQQIQADILNKDKTLQVQVARNQAEDARERERIAADQALRKYELELKYHTDINSQQMESQIAQLTTLMEQVGEHQRALLAAQAQAQAAQAQAAQQQVPQQPAPPQ
jgi:hypothetical protein